MFQKNSKNSLKNINGSVNIGDTFQQAPDSSFRKKVIASLSATDTVCGYIDALKKIVNGKTKNTTVGLERKLSDGGFDFIIERAVETKEHFYKILIKSQYSISVQKMIYAAMEEAISKFTYKISPLIQNDTDKSTILSILHDEIIENLYRDIADIDEYDYEKKFIEGLIYFITGNCYLKWAKDDII